MFISRTTRPIPPTSPQRKRRARPVQANKGSMVTTITPSSASTTNPAPTGTSPPPTRRRVRSTPRAERDDVARRGTLNLDGALEHLLEIANAATYIQGSTQGPTFARPDDVPAIGGIPLRDRRAAFIFRNSFRLTQTVGDWFFRPVASSYVHDFKTDQRYQTTAEKAMFSYENYVDRQDVNGGLDIGYKAIKGTYLVAGYRYGRQDQLSPFATTGASAAFRQLLSPHPPRRGRQPGELAETGRAGRAGHPPVRCRHAGRLRPDQICCITGTPR